MHVVVIICWLMFMVAGKVQFLLQIGKVGTKSYSNNILSKGLFSVSDKSYGLLSSSPS